MTTPITLEVLEARHAAQKGGAAANTRQQARELAARNRVVCPWWALLKAPPRKPQPTTRLAQARAPRPHPLPLPAALIEWRRGRHGRGVTVHADGAVTLTESTGPREWLEARFADAAAAAQAVTPAIPWKRRERAVTFGGARRATG